MVDPWNILGFGGQYSLFPAAENSVYDHRVDELIDLVNEIFGALRADREGGGGRRQCRAATDGSPSAWRPWPAGGTSSPAPRSASSRVSPAARRWESAEHVAAALRAWHAGGHGRRRPGLLAGARRALPLAQGLRPGGRRPAGAARPVAAMALLVQWLSQADEIPLAEENYSFHELALDWMDELGGDDRRSCRRGRRPRRRRRTAGPLTRKFLDYLEANAEEYWEVPRVGAGRRGRSAGDDEDGRGATKKRTRTTTCSARPTRT